MTLDQHLRAREIALVLVEILDGALPELAVHGAAAQEGQDHRQGDLALAEIVADGLAELGLAPGIVERIVDQLEGDAEIHAEAFERHALRPVAAGHHGANLGRRGEQPGGLGLDDLEIGRLRRADVALRDELQHLAFGDRRGGARQHTQHPSEPTSTISSKERVNRKSPTSTEALSPHTEFAVGRPRRNALTSTTSSCSRVAEWMNSTQVASLMCRSSSAV